MRSPIVVVFALLLTTSAALAQMPSTLGYQGVLADAGGNAVTDGLYNVTFRIYDVATGGTALWQETQSVSVTSGLFATQLGAITPITLDFGTEYWLGVQPGGAASELSPRTKLAPGAYAHRARVAEGLVFPFDASANVPSPLDAFRVSNPSGAAITGSSDDNIGVKASHLATFGTNPGLLAETYSNTPGSAGARGVVNTNSGGAGSAGVVGENKSFTNTGYGVWGTHLSAGWGVYGSSIGRGVVGFSGGGSPDAIGVYGETNSDSGAGVKAKGKSTAGTALEVDTGAIKVSGAGINTGTTVFIHEVTPANISGELTIIDHPMLNGNPNAIVIVTYNENPGGGTGTPPGNVSFSVVYDVSEKWAIRRPGGGLAADTYFNVLVIKP